MKKWIIAGSLVVALAVVAVFGWAGVAYAQSQQPPTPGQGYGYGGMMGGYGYGMMGSSGYGPMHQYMVDALAKALNLTPEQLQARIENGETPYEIAQSQGLSQEQIQQVMEDAHDQALDQAVEAGTLTQEQADWMDQHMEAMWSGDFGGFGCHGFNGDSDSGNSSSGSSNSGGSNSSGRFGPMMGGRGTNL